MNPLRFCLLLITLALGACGKEPLYQEEGFVFGTRVEITVYGEDEAQARQAINAAMHEFQRLHDLLHAWQPSPLSELNAALAAGKSKEVPPEIAAILHDATELSAQSDGLFNPALGRLIKLWGFQSDEFLPILPDEKQVAALVVANPQMSDLGFLPQGEALAVGSMPTRAQQTDSSLPHRPSPSGRGAVIGSRNPAVQFDLGGYAKGYALDRAAAILREQGVRNALINIGGNVMALGQHGSRAWRVGIQHPRKPGPIATMELLDGEAIGTSGDYQRYFDLAGQRYCHLIDPRSGHPAHGVQAVTVLTHGPRAGVLSDVSSKAPFMTGPAGWQAAARKMGVEEALLVDAQGVVHLTAAMQKRLEFADKATVRKTEQ
ncbi:MAG: FAD:protein FMN transferase [Nitrosomonadales bacterium]|nr:FAD:protein FMN transferase [Nitrosomonadales bacterium]